MIAALLSTLRWTLSLGAKFGRAIPGHTLTVVLLTLVSQIATLLASFMPLKVVILLGSEGIPRYFPPQFAQINRDALIGALSVATLACFLLYLLAEKLITQITEHGTKRLLLKSHKLVLFENQDEIAANAYQRYSRALAGGVFVTLALGGLGVFYPAITVVMLGYVALSLLVMMLLQQVSAGFRERLETRLIPTLNLFSGIGFFIAFGYLVADFIFWTPPGVIIAIVSLLASRQIMQRLAGGIGDVAMLQGQRAKLDALFFHGRVLLPQQQRADKTMWPLLKPSQRNNWLRLVLTELTDRTPDKLESTWHQLGLPNVAGLRVQADGECYLVKLFETNRSSLALHEATLLAENLQNLPAPRWIGATKVQRYQCVLYALPAGEHPTLRRAKKALAQTKTRLLVVEPSPTLIQRFQRSRPMLWQRLDSTFWERLKVAANGTHQYETVAQFLSRLPALMQELRTLPLAIVNPENHQDALWIQEDGVPVLTNWGAWSLEPIGAGWLDKPERLPLLAPALVKAAEQRTALSSVSTKQSELAALAFALERECNRQRFVQALELLPLLLERLTPLEEPQTTEDAAP